eukprot:m.170799 g.170799  ORF g.170799 m.170799 type:complete len:57 (+) comp16489_c0_seq4:1095-1265(+)
MAKATTIQTCTQERTSDIAYAYTAFLSRGWVVSCVGDGLLGCDGLLGGCDGLFGCW